MIRDFTKTRTNAFAYSSLGQQRYLSCIAQVDAVVGNSSSGLIEAPTLKTGTINIGDRQKGRARAESVIDCAMDRESIGAALVLLNSEAFQESLAQVENPYGRGAASQLIVSALEAAFLAGFSAKVFHDIREL
ncbi:MAG: GDP/UDP-N,N'-diacetylbacillosamine 2-epimerase (hydrolyzing) [Nitrospira sp.]|nr:GDP/UDP-N,N'-diacetylbacillosamine 2-epimerase (hydrolyzing) [Nitrospira sp.]